MSPWLVLWLTILRNVRTFKELLAKDWEELPWCFETSSKNGAGKSELLGYLASLRQLHLKNTR
jgi:GTP-binding protein